MSRLAPLLLFVSLAYSQEPAASPGKSPQSRFSNQIKGKGDTGQQPANSAPVKDQDATSKSDRQRSDIDTKNDERTVRIASVPRVGIDVGRDWYDKGVWVFNALLIIVGVFQLILLFGTLEATQRNAKAAEAAAKAAFDNADATLKSVELIIAKERARLRVVVDKPFINVPFTHGTIGLTILNDGPTPAFIQGAQGGAFFLEPGVEPGLRDFHPLPVETPLDKRQGLSVLVLPFPDMALIRDEQRVLWARGVIVYNDIFEKSRRTAFYLKLQVMRDMAPPHELICYWSTAGNPGDNQQT